MCRCKQPPVDDLNETDCKCLAPIPGCYKDHYDGKCSCECHDCNGGDCDCVLLARLDRPDETKPDWIADHRVRRFVRPVLMRDPQVEIERKKREEDERARSLRTTAPAPASASGKPPKSKSRRHQRPEGVSLDA